MGIVLVPALFDSFKNASDDFAKSKMEYLKTEIILTDTRSYVDACNTGFLIEEIEQVERPVVCVTSKEGDKLFAYIELADGWFYAVDSDGVSCSLPERPKFQAINCKQANIANSKVASLL